MWSLYLLGYPIFRDCGSYHDFLDRMLLQTKKLLNQGILVVKLKSSLRKFYGRQHDDLRSICVVNDHIYVVFVVITILIHDILAALS